MSRNFAYCATRVLDEEGGLVDHPRDPGDRTNLGVTQATLNHARNVIMGLPARVDDLTRGDALLIYEALYWRPMRGDDLPLGLALIVFDCAINQGVGDAARFLQLAVKTAADGIVGDKTLAAVARSKPGATINEVGARRMFDYMQLDHLQDTFGLGWSRRLMRIHDMALAAPSEAH
ncbi:glycoside hydrolase family 108 protein [Novilysobacter erysipheiresistens]|uniref:Glycosyl hydrolase 108 family protein n=1 Tax=Novilysobacter erysipheiresistens TaxID=1749332 RepID=A0ABU7YUR9_9GAMM